MDHVFGRDHYQVIALIAGIADLSPPAADQVISAWKQVSPADRAKAWAGLVRGATERERYQILAASSLARGEALAAAHRMQRMDWALWAAASDAAAAVAAGARMGDAYRVLTAPLATVMPSLLRGPVPAATSSPGVATAGRGSKSASSP